MPEPVHSNDAPASPRIVLDLILGKWRAQAICVAAELGIADILKDGPRSTEEIAKTANLSEDAVYRLLRALASLGLFRSVGQRQFELTPLGAYLRTDVRGSVRGFARFAGHEFTWRPWGELAYSVRTGRPAFDHVFGMESFDYLGEHADAAEIVNDAMSAVTAIESAAIVKAYDFSRVGTIVDVGGGHGMLLAAIVKANPATRGILYELQHAVEGATDLFRRAALAERCTVTGGDFLDSVPEGADAYIMKKVIHDWDDERAIRILRNCHRAMPGGARLLVVDRVIVPGDEPDPGKFTDLEMLVLNYGRERTEPEFSALYAAAGFRLTRVVPTTTPLSIIEGVPV